MHSYFDLLVLAALFVPVALIVVANLLAYRSPGAGEGLLALPPAQTASGPQPARDGVPAAAAEAPGLAELRRAA
jgi:hypothetical protein